MWILFMMFHTWWFLCFLLFFFLRRLNLWRDLWFDFLVDCLGEFKTVLLNGFTLLTYSYSYSYSKELYLKWNDNTNDIKEINIGKHVVWYWYILKNIFYSHRLLKYLLTWIFHFHRTNQNQIYPFFLFEYNYIMSPKNSNK